MVQIVDNEDSVFEYLYYNSVKDMVITHVYVDTIFIKFYYRENLEFYV